MPPGAATPLLVLLAIGAAVAAYAWHRRRRAARDAARLSRAVERRLHEPVSLHPVIDTDRCIGSLSCLKACPEGDILGVVDGAARLIRGSNCVGHGRCAAECPMEAIRLVFGTSERGVDLPEVDANFQSSRPGVHVVGELGGMGLIRNAVAQGLEAAQALAASLRESPAAAGAVDVAIVGSGPAGLATAAGCREAGLSLRLLEQATLGGTMAQYPRHKVVMTEPLELPQGRLAKRTVSKEELIRFWKGVAAKAGLAVEEGVRVTGLEGQDGAFTLLTDKGPVAARKVVLATGRRGSPRRLGVPGEELPKVVYSLLEPEQYAGAKVLVVGGGDSALEAAFALVEEGGAEVTLSYRGTELGRCREANRERFGRLVAEGRLRALLPSQVRRIEPELVVLESGGAEKAVENDFVVVCIGGELPLEFLSKVGVQVRRLHGEAPAALAGGRADRRDAAQARVRRRLGAALAALGVLIVALLAAKGWSYYLLSNAERLRSALHLQLKPAGTWGHGVGVVATAFMLANFLYSARKRLRLLQGGGPIRTWLVLHMFVGFTSPFVIGFHAAFQTNNTVATFTLSALVVVVGTGIVGRFFYGLVPGHGGAALEHAQVLAAFERLKAEAEPLLRSSTDRAAAGALHAAASAPARPRPLAAVLAALPGERLRTELALRRVRAAFPEREGFRRFAASIRRLARLRTQAAFHASLKRLMAGWRLLHAVLAAFLVIAIAAHIALSWYLGYRWVLG